MEGITVNESTGTLINKNNITNMNHPVHIISACPNSEMHCNEINNDATHPGVGVWLEGALLPEQGDQANNKTWDNTWSSSYYTGADYGITGSVSAQFDWDYDNSSNPDFNPNPQPNLINLNGLSSPINDQCNIQLAPDEYNRDSRFGPVVGDSIAYADYITAFTYKGRASLYALLKSDTALFNTGNASDTAFRQFYDYYKTSNIGLLHIIDALIAEGDLDSALVLNEAFTDSNAFEANQKTVNYFIISLLRDSVLSSNDSITLQDIAIQNPITGSKAVFQARAILFLEIHDQLVQARLSMPAILPPAAQQTIKPAPRIMLNPNPAKDNCQITFEGMDKHFSLQVKNILGSTVLQQTLPANTVSVTINTQMFEQGIYFVFVSDDIKVYEQKKLIIVR